MLVSLSPTLSSRKLVIHSFLEQDAVVIAVWQLGSDISRWQQYQVDNLVRLKSVGFL
jgi:hypothetical protein